MKDLRAGIVDYLDLRRSLGFKLKTDERLLLDFAAFMERCGATRITSKLAVAWAQRPETTDPNYLAGRLRAIRSFARYRILMDARTEIPPTDLLPRQRSAFQPHIFHQEEIARLLAASLQRRRGAKPISRWSRYAIFGLLSVTGMRVGEALNLDLEDVDLDHGVLTTRNAKFGKSRLVPVHATTWQCYGTGTGADPERRLPALSTYLGHTHLNYTYWYLHQNPSLMQQAVTRLEHYWEVSA